MALDGEAQNAYILDVNEPVDKYTGKISPVFIEKMI